MQKVCLTGKKVVVAGGDARDLVLARSLHTLGAEVWLFGLGAYGLPAELMHGLPRYADVLILPLPGMTEDGYIYAPLHEEPLHMEQLNRLFRPGLMLLVGQLPGGKQKELDEQGVTVILTAEMDELAVLNAVPTAEGAVEVAMRESKITISGSRALVAGFGRCGLPLAALLYAMGADVTVAARRREVLALAETMRFHTVNITELSAVVSRFDFLFNTVPELVFTEQVLTNAAQEAIIIDIASSPGGTDFYAAERLGLKSFLALGLPGKVAPVTAGRILSAVYPHIICTYGKGGETT